MFHPLVYGKNQTFKLMLIWSGKGILSVLVLLLTFTLLVSVLPKSYFSYAFSLPFFVAGVFSWVMGNKWNKKKERVVIDKKSGQKFNLKPNHSLFWIKLQYWGPVFIILGFLVMFVLGDNAT